MADKKTVLIVDDDIDILESLSIVPVSYTHLKLPTIYTV